MTKSKGVGRTGRPKSTPPGPGTPGTARIAKPGTVEAIEEVLALMAVENTKPNRQSNEIMCSKGRWR
jgi:hypothetical protein